MTAKSGLENSGLWVEGSVLDRLVIFAHRYSHIWAGGLGQTVPEGAVG